MSRRLPVAIAVLAASAAMLGGCGGGADDQATRAASGEARQPTVAYVGTGALTIGRDTFGRSSKVMACDLPSGPCRDIVRFNSDDNNLLSEVAALDYSDGRVFARAKEDDALITPAQQVVSCDVTAAPATCRTLLRVARVRGNVVEVYGPVYQDGRLLLGWRLLGDERTRTYSCDPDSMRSIDDCTRLPLERPVEEFTTYGPGEIIGLAQGPEGPPARDLVVCRVDTGACRPAGTLPARAERLAYIPQFGRAYLGVKGNQMWTCSPAEQSCSRLNQFGSIPRAFTGLGDRVYTGTAESVRACDPALPDRCPSVNRELGVEAMAPYGDRLLVGTLQESDWNSAISGGLYLRPIGGGPGSTVWPDQAGGVMSLDTNALDATPALEITVVRAGTKGSGVTATGRVTVDPAPVNGPADCVLGTAELPVTCSMRFARGTTVTLTATPGPQSALNTWQGAASTCNEPGGPGTPPATTCTVTVTDLVTSATAGFRPE
jgi:hypothetical protein